MEVLALPALFPREVLTALDLQVVEAWAPRSQGCSGCTQMLPFLCPTVRGARDLLSTPNPDRIAAVIPHTCDSMQGLGSILRELGPLPILTFRHPRGGDRPSARAFLRAELRAFIARAEEISGRRIQDDRLSAAIDLHQGIDRTLRRLLRNRTRLPMGDPELYAVLRKREWLPPKDFALELLPLEKALDSGSSTIPGTRLLVSGMVPEPTDILELLDAAGAYIAADDYAAVGRRLPLHDTDDSHLPPLDRLVERMLDTAPCPTRTADPWRRLAWLIELGRQASVRGVILHTVRSCEPELFDVPVLRRGLKDAGFEVLHLETELEEKASGQTATRIEAFVETLVGGSR